MDYGFSHRGPALTGIYDLRKICRAAAAAISSSLTVIHEFLSCSWATSTFRLIDKKPVMQLVDAVEVRLSLLSSGQRQSAGAACAE